MFTGIVEEIGAIKSLSAIGQDQSQLTVECSKIQDDLKLGDSVAVEGVCLTVIRYDQSSATFEISAETVARTLFKSKKKGEQVNLERALRPIDRMGGHIVQGHVDSVSKVLEINKSGKFFEILFSIDPEIEKYVVHKGSICINGISLTVAGLEGQTFKIAVIPHTFDETTLKKLSVGGSVHIETDVVGRYIERMLQFENPSDEPENKISVEFLREHGF